LAIGVTAIDVDRKDVTSHVVDTGGKFAGSVNDAGDQLVAGVIDSSDARRAANIFANFRKTRNGATGIIRCPAEDASGRNLW
jgi:hypothetical protein